MRRSLRVDAGTSVIGCVAQFRPEKRQVNLVNALSTLTEVHRLDVVLVLVGDGPEENALRDYVELKNLSNRVRFVGRVEDVRPYLSAFDVSVMPSVAVEVFSNALLESIAMDVPVISSDVGGSAEMIEHELEGFIYSRNDLDMLTEYLRRLILDRELANRFSICAKNRLDKEFTKAQMDRNYIDVLWEYGKC